MKATVGDGGSGDYDRLTGTPSDESAAQSERLVTQLEKDQHQEDTG